MTGHVLAAGGDIPRFLPELVALVGGAAVVGYACSRLRVVPIVGFLLAGVAIGPHQLGLVHEQEVVDAAAEVGVILLLFTIGLELSLDRLARIRRLVLAGGALQVGLTTAAVAIPAALLGVAVDVAVFTGFLVALSSTAIVLTVLADRHETGEPHGQAALGVLVFQDLVVVGMVLLVPVLGGSGGGAGGVATAVVTATALIAVVLLVARRILPRLLDAVARTCSQEVFLLALVAVCFGTALVSAAVGVSVSLGAFLAGVVVSESRHGSHAMGEVLPLQILFSATFFVSVGMLLDLGILAEEPWLVAGAVLGIVAVKVLTGAVAVRAAGASTPVALATAVLLAQVGELSFVLEELGRAEGLFPLGLGEDGSQALVAATVVLMVGTPWLAVVGRRLESVLGAGRVGTGRPAPAVPVPDGGRAGHVLVLGYGDLARSVVGELRAIGAPFTVLTLNPDAAAEAQADGVDVVVGDYAKHSVLRHVGVDAARAVVVADDEPERAHRVTVALRDLNPAVAVVVRPDGVADVGELADAGADHVVTPERASRIGLALAVRDVLGAGGPVALSRIIRFEPVADTACPHVGAIAAVQPSAYGCEDCLRTGGTWVHLRICTTCGHVGCCDSSPGRHARRHAAEDDHPIAASLEPGESWAWCFLDETELPAAGDARAA